MFTIFHFLFKTFIFSFIIHNLFCFHKDLNFAHINFKTYSMNTYFIKLHIHLQRRLYRNTACKIN